MGGGEIIKKGWLVKSPPLETSSMKSWRKRWFCLRSSKVLEYYKNETSNDMKGVVNLEDCVSVHASLFHRKYKHVFDIQTKDRIYYLVTSTAEEMENWVNTICKVCGFYPTTQNKDNNTENISPSNNKRHSLTLPSNFSIRTTPLPPLPSEELEGSDGPCPPHRLLAMDVGSASHTSKSTGNLRVQVPPGTSFTQALAAKGYGSGNGGGSTSGSGIGSGGERYSAVSVASSASCSQENVTLEYYVPRPQDHPSYLENLGFQTYDVPTVGASNAMPPNRVPDWYDVPRSLLETKSSFNPPPEEMRARLLSNNYMVPRLVLAKTVSTGSAHSQPTPPHAVYWATPPSDLYDYPPPPRLADGNTYDYPPPPRLADESTYDYPPPPRLADESTYDYPPPPRLANENTYDYPPPPRLADDENTYDYPPPPRLANRDIYDYPPPPRPLETSSRSNYDRLPPLPTAVSTDMTDSPKALVPPRPLDDSIVEVARSLPVTCTLDETDTSSSTVGYVNVAIPRTAGPPPIDRETKPIPPRIDRSTKPRSQNGTPRTTPEGTPPLGPSPPLVQAPSSLGRSSPSSEEETSESRSRSFSYNQDVPRLTRDSIRYCQVTFPRKPVPTPRGARPKTPPQPLQSTCKVNYADVDLSAIVPPSEKSVGGDSDERLQFSGSFEKPLQQLPLNVSS